MNEYVVHFLKETTNVEDYTVRVYADSLDEAKDKVHYGEFEVIDIESDGDICQDFEDVEITSIK